MAREKTAETLLRLGALQTGHFRLTSGYHSDRYIQCARLFERPQESETLCAELARRFADERIDLVASPAIGGIIMGYETARALGTRNVFAERENDRMVLRRGFSVQRGERVLVLEDVVTTGGSVKEVIALFEALGATVVGVGAIVDRSSGQIDFGVPFRPLMTLDVQKWEESTCPLCKEGKPIVKPGSRPLPSDPRSSLR